jgi:uncharacterized protein YndB with AHSA1/START domain
MADIKHLAKIHSSPERIYQALTTADDIRGWWTRDAVLDSRVGGTGEFGFFNRSVVAKVRVDELTPPTRVSWRAVSSGVPGWDGTTITFDLRAEAGDTLVLLSHRGFAQAYEGYEKTSRGWASNLLSLHRYLETGEGRPH